MKKIRVMALASVLAIAVPIAHAGFWSNLACSIGEILGGVGCAVVQTVDFAFDTAGAIAGSVKYSTSSGLTIDLNLAFKDVGAAAQELYNDVISDDFAGQWTPSSSTDGDILGTYTTDGDGLSCWNECNPVSDCDW